MIYTNVTKLFCDREIMEFKPNSTSPIYLENKDVAIYHINIPDHLGSVGRLRSMLDQVELDRAARYYHNRDENRFIICRAYLKQTLAAITEIDINEIVIDYGVNKKPFLKTRPEVFFNLSHSGEHALLAVGKVPVGIDIEKIKNDPSLYEMMPWIFNAREIEAILGSDDSAYSFFKFWTRKEAFVKGTGEGIDALLKTKACMDETSTINGDKDNIHRKWFIKSFQLGKTYLGAIAVNNIGMEDQKISLQTLLPLSN